MYGLFQTVYYFGYMAVFSVGLGLMCGKICHSILHLNEAVVVILQVC